MTATLQGSAALAVESMRADVDVLLEAELTSLSSTELTGLVAGLETQRREMGTVSRRDSTARAHHRATYANGCGDKFPNYFLQTFWVRPELSYPCFRFGS